MLNRVITRIIKSAALIILITSAMLYLYIWTWRVARERLVYRRADTFRDLAVSQVPQTTIPLDGERISTTPPTLLHGSDTIRSHTLPSPNLATSCVGGSLQPDPAHPHSERSERRKEGLIKLEVEAFPRPPGENFDPSSTARWSCTPTPYAPNVTVLGRVLEKCVPRPTSTSTTGRFSQDDIYITIKTTQKNHNTRLRPIVLTWLQTVQPDQVRLPIRVTVRLQYEMERLHVQT